MSYPTIHYHGTPTPLEKEICELYWKFSTETFEPEMNVGDIAARFGMKTSQVTMIVKRSCQAEFLCPCPCGAYRKCRNRNETTGMRRVLFPDHGRERIICDFYETELAVRKRDEGYNLRPFDPSNLKSWEEAAQEHKVFSTELFIALHSAVSKKFPYISVNMEMDKLIAKEEAIHLYPEDIHFFERFEKSHIHLICFDGNGKPVFALIPDFDLKYLPKLLAALDVEFYRIPEESRKAFYMLGKKNDL